jgi:hypothetical protein
MNCREQRFAYGDSVVTVSIGGETEAAGSPSFGRRRLAALPDDTKVGRAPLDAPGTDVILPALLAVDQVEC